eukprot:11180562-Lingulodinium_polyedra.AAC.1
MEMMMSCGDGIDVGGADDGGTVDGGGSNGNVDDDPMQRGQFFLCTRPSHPQPRSGLSQVFCA